MRIKTIFKSLLLAALGLSLLAAACTNPDKAKVAHVRRGEEYLQKKQYQKAVLEFRSAAQIDDRYADAYWGLARAYEGDQMMDDAFKALRRLVTINPNHLDALSKLGNYAIVAQQISAAESIAQEILQKSPDHVEGHILQASIHFYKNRPQDALAEIKRALEIDPARSETYLYLADYYNRVKDPVRAEENFRRSISFDNVPARAHVAYGNFLTEQGRRAEAEAAFRKAVEADPDDRNMHLTLGGFYLATGQPGKAAEVYKALAAREAERPDGNTALAFFYANTGRREEGVNLLRKAAADWPEDKDVKLHLAELLLAGNDTDGALAQLGDVLKDVPGHRKALLMRAQLCFATQRFNDAIEDAKKLLKDQPRLRLAHYILAEASYRAGKYEEAAAAAGSFVMYYPKDPPAMNLQGQTYLALGDAKPALRISEEVLELLSKGPQASLPAAQKLDMEVKALTVRGYARMMLGDRKGALADMQAVLRKIPDSSVANANLARASAVTNNAGEAASLFDRALSLDSRNLNALQGVSALYATQNRPEEALAYLDRALTGPAGDQAQLHYLKAQMFFVANKPGESEAELRRALELDPNMVNAYYALAAHYVATGQTERGIAEYRKIVERKLDSATTYLLLGMIYDKGENYEAAIENYRKALELNPNEPYSANNLAWMFARKEKGPLFDAARLS
ncbi:MAG TPA: tetratricopeptide repeat protein, partial [Pyrinomonadaceae bacterium]|nr:tetratricopeptide repeat protein [Pyrinomonadaceae bacterium]